MATINFLYRSTKEQSSLNIRLLYRLEGIDYVYGAKTLLKVDKEYWEKYHDQKRPKSIEIANRQREVNAEINNIQNFVLSAFEKALPSEVDKSWLQTKIDNYYNREPEKVQIPQGLIQFVDYYIREKGNDITPSTVKKLNVVKHKLERYEKDKKVTLLISEINEQFKNNFIAYCTKENYAIGTIQRDLVFIKTFCNYAYEKGLEVDRNLNKLRIKVKKEIKHPYLSLSELEQIEKAKLNESLSNVRDWLIISCYTGQRISDFMNFNASMIRVENGKPLLEFRQKKTNKLMTIPILPKVMEILEKRGGEFPNKISDQKYNDYLKEVCKKAKINQEIEGSKKMEVEVNSGKYRKDEGVYEKWELVSSHIGRRSFATNFYGKIPTSHLIFMTGHTTERMFLEYIGKSTKDTALELFNYF